MIKAIIFDCFGVLTTDLWKEFVAGISDESALGQAKDLNRAYDAGFINLQEFLEGVEQATGLKPQRVEDLLANKGEIAKNTELLNYIRDLRARGYQIGLLSNIGTNWIRDTFLTPAEQALFDDMVMSFEVGMTKPNPRIFELACNNLGVQPEQAIMIDDVDLYCSAAREIGMRSIVYSDFRQLVDELESELAKKS